MARCCFLGQRRWDRLGRRSRCFDGPFDIPCPDQYRAFFVHRKSFGFDHFVFEVFEILVIEVKPSFQGTIRDTLLTLEQFEDLVEDVVEGHR